MVNEQAILQKLKSKARSKKLPYQLILQLFCQEEFLRRLAASDYKNNLILKGGLFLFSYSGFEGRPTMDIDFLAKNIPNDKEAMEKVIDAIISVDNDNSYVRFSIKSTENIAEMKAYHGVRLKVMARLGNTKTPFDIDIGVGDVVVPSVDDIRIPTQLEGFVLPVVSSYSLESTIAEKLEAMIDRMETTSRMKDYYDIFYLAQNYDFEGNTVSEAIKQTFEKRKTSCSLESLERVVTMHTSPQMQQRWNAFCKRSLGVKIDFNVVTEMIGKFVKPAISAIVSGKEMNKKWSKDKCNYIDR